MSTWPEYLKVREALYQGLVAELDCESLPNEALLENALKRREQFWTTGECSSSSSYKYAYEARILLELAHEREPADMKITDELVETIQATWVAVHFDPNDRYVRDNSAVKDLLGLRSAQFQQVKAMRKQGQTPTWEDFVRVNDLGWLLHRDANLAAAQEVVQWLIANAHEGGWAAYQRPLETWQRRLSEGKQGYRYTIYTETSEPEVRLKYGRRAPSFKGPDAEARGVAPVHLSRALPEWHSQ
jgi:hypothetical protein